MGDNWPAHLRAEGTEGGVTIVLPNGAEHHLNYKDACDFSRELNILVQQARRRNMPPAPHPHD